MVLGQNYAEFSFVNKLTEKLELGEFEYIFCASGSTDSKKVACGSSFLDTCCGGGYCDRCIQFRKPSLQLIR